MRDPSTVPLRRLMTLRRYPGLADAELAELAVLADNFVEQDYVSGAVVTRVGRVPAIHLVLEGRIEMGAIAWGPNDLVGSLEAMAGRAVQVPMIAVADTRTLQIAAGDFADIVEDNFGLLSNVRRAVARRLIAKPRPRARRPQLVVATRPLGLVERLLALRHQPPFASGKAHTLAALAAATREVEWPANAKVAREGEPGNDAYIILEGTVRASGEGVLRPGDAVGMLACLAEVAHRDAEALTATRTLHVPAGAILDLVEDHTELGLAMIANLAGELLDRSATVDDAVN